MAFIFVVVDFAVFDGGDGCSALAGLVQEGVLALDAFVEEAELAVLVVEGCAVFFGQQEVEGLGCGVGCRRAAFYSLGFFGRYIESRRAFCALVLLDNRTPAYLLCVLHTFVIGLIQCKVIRTQCAFLRSAGVARNAIIYDTSIFARTCAIGLTLAILAKSAFGFAFGMQTVFNHVFFTRVFMQKEAINAFLTCDRVLIHHTALNDLCNKKTIAFIPWIREIASVTAIIPTLQTILIIPIFAVEPGQRGWRGIGRGVNRRLALGHRIIRIGIMIPIITGEAIPIVIARAPDIIRRLLLHTRNGHSIRLQIQRISRLA